MHKVPDPPTQSGCTGCDLDLHHGLFVGDRVVVIAPMTARMTGTIIGFALDTADVWVDGRPSPSPHIHAKWLAPVLDVAAEQQKVIEKIKTTVEATSYNREYRAGMLAIAYYLGMIEQEGKIGEPDGS